MTLEILRLEGPSGELRPTTIYRRTLTTDRLLADIPE
jgi:hypothetical protein